MSMFSSQILDSVRFFFSKFSYFLPTDIHFEIIFFSSTFPMIIIIIYIGGSCNGNFAIRIKKTDRNFFFLFLIDWFILNDCHFEFLNFFFVAASFLPFCCCCCCYRWISIFFLLLVFPSSSSSLLDSLLSLSLSMMMIVFSFASINDRLIGWIGFLFLLLSIFFLLLRKFVWICQTMIDSPNVYMSQRRRLPSSISEWKEYEKKFEEEKEEEKWQNEWMCAITIFVVVVWVFAILHYFNQ